MLKKPITALSMFVLFLRLHCQPYPVDAFLQMRPPFSPFLEELNSGIPPSMNLQLLLLDDQETGYPVRLRFSINGEGISLMTRPDFVPAPLFLDQHRLRIVQQEELAAYFLPENLIFQGLSQNDFVQSGGKLPEGIYNFCVEVIDHVRLQGAALSNQSCAVIELSELDPPIITAPLFEENIQRNLPILFQWVPQHIGAFPASYHLRLYERPGNMSIDQILSHTPPLFKTSTGPVTSFLYDLDEPPLQGGTTYLIQVQIEDLLGKHHFKNLGYSEISIFKYGLEGSENNEDCLLYARTQVPDQIGESGFQARWLSDANADYYEFDLSYDSLFTEMVSDYQSLSVTDTSFWVSGLVTSNWFYYRVRSVAGDCFSDYSPPRAVYIGKGCQNLFNEPLTYTCGATPDLSPFSELPLIDHLQKGDSIWANDFQITLTEATGHGTFFGKGFVTVPYLQHARLNVLLKGIKVDQNCRLVDGYIHATGVGISIIDEDVASAISGILDALETVEDILEASQEILNGIDQIIAEAEPYLPDSILQALIDAQTQFDQAQAAYEAALNGGNEAEIAAAKTQLEAAKTALEKALKDYKKALTDFFKALLDVVSALFKNLLEDCVRDQLSAQYAHALQSLDYFIDDSNQQAIQALPFNSHPNTEIHLRDEFEEVYYEDLTSSSDLPAQTFDQLVNTFYEKEMSYLLCLSFERLQEELDTPEELQVFQSLFKELGASSFDSIGEKIKQGWATERIVPEVKGQLTNDLIFLLKKVNYPAALSSTN